MLNKVSGRTLQGFPAGTFNTMVDIVRRVQKEQTRFRHGEKRQKPEVVWFRNDNAATCPMGGVVRITGVVDVKDQILLTGDMPNGSISPPPLWIVSRGPVASGKIGSAVLFDMCRAAYNVADGTPAFGEVWGPQSGDWKLRKLLYGFEILGRPADGLVTAVQMPWRRQELVQLAGSLTAGGAAAANPLHWTGTVWGAAPLDPISVWDIFNNPYMPSASRIWVQWHEQAERWVNLFYQDELLGKLDFDLTPGHSQNVSIWAGAGGMEADTGVNVTAFDWLLNSNQKLAAGSFVVVTRINLEWYVTASRQCPVVL